MTEWLPLILSTFSAGVLGSGHCFAMCGGIAGSLGVLQGQRLQGGKGRNLAAAQFNFGRIAAYTLLGALLAMGFGWTGNLLEIQSWGLYLRLLSAVLVAVIGLYYLLDWQGLAWLERLGAGLWRRISPLALRASQRRDGAGRLLTGLCWGFLPCGLVYTVLATAASTGHAIGGAVTMLAFGLGTLPAMLGLSLAAPSVSGLLRDKGFRRLIGFFLLLLAATMVYSSSHSHSVISHDGRPHAVQPEHHGTP